jgi:fatty acid synthase
MRLVCFVQDIHGIRSTQIFSGPCVPGPSYVLDSACSSSLYAIEHAYKAIQNGQCDSAIVGASNLCMHPYISLMFSRLGMLNPEGLSKVFDRDGMYILIHLLCVYSCL